LGESKAGTKLNRGVWGVFFAVLASKVGKVRLIITARQSITTIEA